MAATLRRAGFGIAPIAELFGIRPRLVHDILRREGVPTSRGRRVLTTAEEAGVHHLRSQGWTLTAIGARFSISRDTVRQTLRRGAPTD